MTCTAMCYEFLILFLILTSITTTKQEHNLDIELVTDSINQFSLELYKNAANEVGDENFVVSPFSAEIPLALLSLGAWGLTKHEINNVLHIPNALSVKLAFKRHLTRLNSARNIILNIASKIYVKDNTSFAFKSNFVRLTENVFFSEIENANFKSGKNVTLIMNEWVENKTNTKIKNLVSPDTINSNASMIIVNAIYFMSDWRISFETSTSRFHVNPEKYIIIDIMCSVNMYRFTEILEWNSKVLEIPYLGEDMSMVIFLPNAVNGLSDLERKLENCNIDEIFNRLKITEVKVTIPKFKIESQTKLNSLLSQLGINLIFDSKKSNLSSLIQSNETLYISEFVQRAFVDVNEKGIEMDIAIGKSREERLPRRGMEFKAQHPFFFIIKQKNLIIFCGKYTGV
ncbi:serine protease inhibitor 3/4-like [Arctopsyche grandis]|uniref:serine protease inhibitor 3/4-like n=1 Tax=Arctopsyche grandis TaxID=121162 RepID=UPI00406D9DAF